ncbi:hypothetical protein DN069_19275 [Streptacidiphilus pinicola]|uniref:Uncharacterized protein n=2 Tax=Streptacidiphilus pinicola TaxID=2219663 RepID=A0A2X0IG81_9ACTN|nr:hypothetical protein DN069_19275 [Streptacidiphilus pinicola]
MKRQHVARMKALALQEVADSKRAALEEVQAKRDFVLRMTGLCVGSVLGVGMLVAAMIAVMHREPWLASAWGSTGMLGIIAPFVPRLRGSSAAASS